MCQPYSIRAVIETNKPRCMPNVEQPLTNLRIRMVQVYLSWPTLVPPIQTERLVTTIGWQINHVTHYALEGSVFTGGSLIQWLRDELGIIMSAHESSSLAQTVTSSNGVVVVPAFTGLGAPHWDAAARGAIFGLTRGANKAHLARACLEALAFQTRDVIDAIHEAIAQPFTTLKVDGGASENNWLMQFQANLLNMSVVKPVATESTALGAAMIAGRDFGYFNEAGIRQNMGKTACTFSPTHTPDIDVLYANWARAVERSLKWE